MITNVTIQAALISYAKLSTPIVTSLGTADQIKEASWQGKNFVYPALRIARIRQGKDLRGMRCNYGYVTFSWITFSQEASSQQADTIAGVVNSVFDNLGFAHPGILFNRIWCVGLIGAVRVSEQLWRSQNDYRAMITIR